MWSRTISATCSLEGACHGAHSRPLAITTRIVRAAIVHARLARRVLKRDAAAVRLLLSLDCYIYIYIYIYRGSWPLSFCGGTGRWTQDKYRGGVGPRRRRFSF